jgi:hypothetical protein
MKMSGTWKIILNLTLQNALITEIVEFFEMRFHAEIGAPPLAVDIKTQTGSTVLSLPTR